MHEGKRADPCICPHENGQTTCICKQGNKKCDRVDCERDMVERDAYRDVEKLFKQDRYGKCREIDRHG